MWHSLYFSINGLPLSGNKYATIISTYASTMINTDEVKDKFCDAIGTVISATPHTDKLIILDDFNARVGTDHQTWEGVVGSERKCNSNGLLFLRKCVEHDLLITNLGGFPSNKRKQDIMDVSSFETLASH